MFRSHTNASMGFNPQSTRIGSGIQSSLFNNVSTVQVMGLDPVIGSTINKAPVKNTPLVSVAGVPVYGSMHLVSSEYNGNIGRGGGSNLAASDNARYGLSIQNFQPNGVGYSITQSGGSSGVNSLVDTLIKGQPRVRARQTSVDLLSF